MEREDYCRGLEQLAAWLREHPEVPLPTEGRYKFDSFSIPVPGSGEEEAQALAAITRALPRPVEKSFGAEQYGLIYMNGQVGGLHVQAYANRNSVCERVVVGTETVEVPDPNAPKVPEVVELVEWRCRPLLAAGSDGQ